MRATITHVDPSPEYLAERETSHWSDGLGLYLVVALVAAIVVAIAR